MQADKDMNAFLDSVGPIRTGTPVTEATAAKKPDRPTFQCFECNGTGIWKGHRVHQEKTQCFACKGKGYFFKSAFDRNKAKAQRATSKAKKLEAAQAAYIEANPKLIEGLREICGWHQFAQTLLESFAQWGSLTDGQTAAAQRTLIKVAEGRAIRDAANASKTGDVDVAQIVAAFAARMAKPFKKLPRFLTERLIIAAASPSGKNPGAIYVHCDGAYAGKIVAGTFKPVSSAPADILELVRAVAANPLEIAKAYGKKTGICSCCGRELTDAKSIEAGIGPVCVTKWGF